jgi:phage terminase large subunit GpA-like protein
MGMVRVCCSSAETWVETGEAPDWQRLYERRESWQIGIVPRGGLFLTAGADVQKDRIEVDVWAWGRGLESWLVEHIVVDGGPERAETWDQLGVVLARTWLHDGGTRLGLAKLAIDTGYDSPAVYAWARKMGHAQVAPIKGVEGFNRVAPIAGPTHVDVTEGGKKLRRGARLWTIAVATFQSETYGRFGRRASDGDGDVIRKHRRPCQASTRAARTAGVSVELHELRTWKSSQDRHGRPAARGQASRAAFRPFVPIVVQ